MPETTTRSDLPPIPGKRYFTIGEVSDLCDVKPHVLRYWEQEFIQLRPVKRRGNRRYYQRHDVLMVRQIRSLLYEQGFTIGGARQRLGTVASEVCVAEVLPSENPQDFLVQIRKELDEILKLLEP
ncbi:MerR family transcriptional regulator [Gammaproteobacteria bacterium]